eukprot:3111912-Prymnesium_polylepis.1
MARNHVWDAMGVGLFHASFDVIRSCCPIYGFKLQYLSIESYRVLMNGTPSGPRRLDILITA